MLGFEIACKGTNKWAKHKRNACISFSFQPKDGHLQTSFYYDDGVVEVGRQLTSSTLATDFKYDDNLL